MTSDLVVPTFTKNVKVGQPPVVIETVLPGVHVAQTTRRFPVDVPDDSIGLQVEELETIARGLC